MEFVLVLLLAIYIPNFTEAARLPAGIPLCKEKDPNFDKCALNNGRKAIPILIHGVKSLDIPDLAPFKIPFVQLQSSPTLQLNITDLEVRGLENSQLENVHVDFDKQEGTVTLTTKDIKMDGHYIANGKVLILPIVGDGVGHINLTRSTITYKFNYALHEKKGHKYAKITKNSFSFTVDKAEFLLENLFNGNKMLGDEMNKFLNENWSDVLQDFRQVIGETIASICYQVLSKIVDKIPYDNLFEQ